MPYGYFKPVGPAFIQKCNVQFDLQPPLDPNEFGRYSFGYMVYMDVGGVHNYLHPGYYRRADRLLQVQEIQEIQEILKIQEIQEI